MITSDQIASQFPQQQFGTQGGYYAPAPGPSAYPPQFTYQWNGGWQHRAAERAGEMRMRPYANLGDAFGQMAATAASVQMFAGGADAVGSLFGVDTFSSLANSRFLAGATRLDPFSSAFTGAMAGGSAAWGAGAGAVARGAIGGALGTGGLLHPVTLGAYGLVKAGESVYQGYREQKGVNALLGGYNFTNPSSFTGKGFSMEQKFQIGNTLRAFDSSDAYTSFQDALSVLERFNTLGMGQGVRSAEAFGKKFREMAETVRVMSKTMNTSIDEATSVFGALRMAGISSPGGMIGMGRTMRVLSSGGMTSADIAGMVNTGSAVSRSFGMRGEAGARAATGLAETLTASAGMGITSAEELMDITGAADLSSASASLATDVTGRLGNFLTNTSTGKALLAAVGQQDASGRFTGEVNTEALARVANGDMNVRELSVAARKNLRTKDSQLSYTNRSTDIASRVLEQDPMGVTQAIIGSLKEQRPDLNEEELFLYAMEHIAGMDRRQAKLFQKEFENYQKVRQEKASRRMTELQQALFETDTAKNHTFRGMTQGITGTISDMAAPIREYGASTYVHAAEAVEHATDYAFGRVRFESDAAVREAVLNEDAASVGEVTADSASSAIFGDYAALEKELGKGAVRSARMDAKMMRDRWGMKIGLYGESAIGFSEDMDYMLRGQFQDGFMPSPSGKRYALALHYAGYDQAASEALLKEARSGGFADEVSGAQEQGDAAIRGYVRQRSSGNMVFDAILGGTGDYYTGLKKSGAAGLFTAMNGKMTGQELVDFVKKTGNPTAAARQLSAQLGIEVTEEALRSAVMTLNDGDISRSGELISGVAGAAKREQRGADYAAMAVSLTSEDIAGINSKGYNSLLTAARAAGSGVGGDVTGAIDSYLKGLSDDDLTALGKTGPMGQTLARASMLRKSALNATSEQDLLGLGATAEDLARWKINAKDGLSAEEREAAAKNIASREVRGATQSRGATLTATTEKTMLEIAVQMNQLANTNNKFAEQVQTLVTAQKKQSTVPGGTTTPVTEPLAPPVR